MFFVVSQQFDFSNKVPKAPSVQSTKPVEVPQAAAAATTTTAVANGEQEGKDKKEKKKKPAQEG